MMFMASPAMSQEISYYAGISATSNYVSNGITQTSGNPAIQPYLEMEYAGFYAGTWLSNVDFGTGDHVEIDLYLGYRTTLAEKLYVDVGYARYFYDDSGDCCGELKLTAVYPILPNLAVEAYLAYDTQSHNLNKRGKIAYKINDQLAVSGRYGETESNDNEYWDVGGSYAFNEKWSADLRYYGAETGDEGVVFTLSLATSQSTFSRLFVNPFTR